MTVLVLGAIHVSLVHWYRGVVMHDDLAERTLRQFGEIAHPVHELAVGDSHVKWGIQPEVLGDSFNFAMPGERYVETFYRLRSLLDEGLPVRVVVVQADPNALAEEPPRGLGFLHYYAGFVDYPALGWERGEPLPYLARWIVGRYVPYAGARDKILRFLDTGEPWVLPRMAKVTMSLGAMRTDLSLADKPVAKRRKKARDRVRAHFPTGRGDPVAAVHLQRILELCRERGVRVLLVKFPLSDAYLSEMAEVLDLPWFDARIAEAESRFENARVLDLRHRFRGEPSLFADVNHLNVTGAARASRLVRSALRLWQEEAKGP